MKILILNGSIHGSKGNCAHLVKDLKKNHKAVSWDVAHLLETPYNQALVERISKADALLFLSGTYWDSWGSPLQKFLEDATDLEARPEVLGKPAGVCILMHSVGGKGVLSRLQGVLSTFGFMIPPFSGMTYSLSSQLAVGSDSPHADDFWTKEDLNIVVEDLIHASEVKTSWAAWPVDRKNFRKKWIHK